MLFNSVQFLLFFPVVTVLYFFLPHRFRWLLLLLASCIFYMAWIPAYVLILFLIIGVDYLAALQIEKSAGARRKMFLAVSVTANISLLAIFKYYGFIADNLSRLLHAFNASAQLPLLNLILPIGLSFHTFQALAYTIEVYKGKQAAERHLGIYALYVMFYPQLVAGPIERPQHLIHQFKEEKSFHPEMVTSGLRLMLWGFFKKLLIADRLAILVNTVYNNPHQYAGAPLLFATYCFAFQIYCDFSGYTDIAIGAARVMGINLMRNFNCPYAALSVQDFWRRWHISLSTWFRDYLYIPMGGNKVAGMATVFNLLIVFFVSGLWHGASWTFAVWGLLHGFYMIVFLQWSKHLTSLRSGGQKGTACASPLLKMAAWFVTFNAVCFAWIFFRANSTGDAFWIAGHLLPLQNADSIYNLGLTRGELLLSILCVVVLEVVQYIGRQGEASFDFSKMKLSWRWIAYYSLILTILLLGEFGGQKFIYFQF